MPSSLGPAEILVILVVGLIVLGPNRLPEAGRQIGRALGEIRRWSEGMQTEMRDAFSAEPPRAPAPPTVVAEPPLPPPPPLPGDSEQAPTGEAPAT